MSSGTSVQVSVDEDRLAALERRVEQLEEESKQKDDYISTLEGRVDELENELQERPRTEFRGTGGDPRNLWIGKHPIGKIVFDTKQRSVGNDSRIDDLERGEVNVSDVIDAGSNDGGLQIQRWRADVKQSDHPDDVSGLTANQARSTELWSYFPKLSDASHGKRKLQRSDATKIFRNLSDYELPADRNTVNRCMRFMARATGATDDEENDDHLVTFQPGDEGSESVLVADQDEWETFVANLTGVDAPDRDSKGSALDVPASSGKNGESDPSADDATQHVVEDSGTGNDGMGDRPRAGEL